jgi:hypothetical protein
VNVKKKTFKDVVVAMDSIPAKSRTWIQFDKARASESASSSSVCRLSVNYKLLYMLSVTGYSVLCMILLSQSHSAVNRPHNCVYVTQHTGVCGYETEWLLNDVTAVLWPKVLT